MDPSVEKALVDVVDTAYLQGKAVLVGGQAMADWYAWLHHCEVIPADMGPLATPRPTTDRPTGRDRTGGVRVGPCDQLGN